MAQSYDRRINLYINIDGKEVKNNVASINAEMRKIVNGQKQMTIGSDEYLRETKKIQQLKGILNQHYEDVAKVSKSWSFKGMAEGFNKYFGIVAAGIATVTGIIYSMNAATKASNDFEEKLANLSAITGLTGSSLEWLGNKAKEMSTSTLEGGIHITKSADEIVDAFTKMGSARPELLQNKEALALVTEKALVLAEASKMELEPAIAAVAASMNQFNLGASESDRIINAMGAGALEGSSEVSDLTDSLKNVGAVANDSNMTLEQTIAALEVLGEKQLKGEEAGTKLRGALLKLKDAGMGYASGQFNMRDALEEVNIKLAAQSGALERDALKQKVFGIENVTAGTILLANIEKYDKLTIAVTGTDVAIRQAAKNTATNTALMAQAKNEFHNASIELGKNLSPAMTALYQVAGSVAKAFSKMIVDSPGEALAKEGILVNRLATELANSNTPLERRKTILFELKEINPKIAEGLDAENLNYKTLTGNIQAYNAELSNRILLENLSEDEKKYASQSAKYKEKFGDAQIEINRIISQTDQGIALSNASMEEKIIKTLDILKSKARWVDDYSNAEADAFDRLTALILQSTDAQKKLNEAQGKEIDFAGRIKEMKKILGIADDIKAAAGGTSSNPANPNAPTTDPAAPAKTTADPAKAATDALELAYKQQQLLLKQKYADDETIQKEYHARMLANELAYMQSKLQLTTDESSRIDIQSQIIDKQREFTAAIKEATPELLLNRDGINQRNSSLFEEAKLLGFAAQKQAEGTAAMEQYTAKQQMQTEAIQGMSDIMTGYISDAMSGSIDEYQTFGDTMILMSLQMLKMMVPIWSAWILGYSLADPVSVATVGVKGMINYAIVTGLLYAGISAVEGVVKSGISKKREAATGAHATGGFANEPTYVVSEDGKPEWISPNWMLKHPTTGPMIAQLENWRKTRYIPTSGAVQASQMPRFAEGGFSGASSTSNPAQPYTPAVAAPGMSYKQLDRLSAILEKLESKDFSVDVVTFKKKEAILNKFNTGGFKRG